MIDIVKLYTSKSIAFADSGKHVQKGWVGTPCPFCSGNFGYHLGYCVDPSSKFYGAFSCWRCGGKNKIEALSRILSVSKKEAYSIYLLYSSENSRTNQSISQQTSHKVKKGECFLPAGTESLKTRHKKYLTERNFDSEKLTAIWQLAGTGPVGRYKHRIIAPIYYKGVLVSYQGRDITGNSELKYKACAEGDEVRSHKHCLYGFDLVPKDNVVVVEGITDVWRLGVGAVATFGVKYKQAQVLLLQQFKNIFIMYDSENEDPEAAQQANKLSEALVSPERIVEIIELSEGDPGSLAQHEADYIMKQLL